MDILDRLMSGDELKCLLPGTFYKLHREEETYTKITDEPAEWFEFATNYISDSKALVILSRSNGLHLQNARKEYEKYFEGLITDMIEKA